MKTNRQSIMLDIINAHQVETQEDFARLLAERGIKVTQATISRDIKALHLVKIQGENGIYKYSVNENYAVSNSDKLLRVFRETVLDIQSKGCLIVVHTLNGSANAAAEVIDTLNIPGIIGSIAGDNTIFLAADSEKIDSIRNKLNQIAKS